MKNDRTDFRIWFWHRARLVKVEVNAPAEANAIEYARHEFMERFGYWPGNPHQVDRYTPGMT